MRSLIFAGGGLKVAFQAGVLQVWLDETGLTFDHGDGASGGVFNLAMWAQGMSGREIADNWRGFAPTRAISINPRGWLWPFGATSLFTFDRFRRRMLRDAWGLDWDEIRSTPRDATFNVYNFTQQRHEVRTAEQMTEDLLISGVSLPLWFPPVVIDGDVYIDPVYATDANLEEAIRRGADELWVIWTVSEGGEWRNGPIHHYFQIIEAAANSRIRDVLDRIERSNAAIAAGMNGEFGRRIMVQMLRAEVPLHYLFTLRANPYREAVELGVEAGRRWCRDQGFELTRPS
jgi:predicted patatin/cPLA2 family phospholipase